MTSRLQDLDELDELDARWCAAEDALALGEEPEPAPPAADARWADAWGRERAFYAALAREAAGAPGDRRVRSADDVSGTATTATAEDLALVESVLAQHQAASEADSAVPARGPSVRWVAALVLAVAAAVVLGWVAFTPELGLRGSHGAWIAEEDQRRHGVGDALPMAVWLVAEAGACAALDEASLCAGQGTVVRVHPGDGHGVRVEVRRGTVTLDGALAVDTPAGQLRGDDTSVYEVRVSEDHGAIEVEVRRGSLELQQGDDARRLDAGEHLRLGADAAELGDESEPATPAIEDGAEPEPAPRDGPSSTAGRNATKVTDPAALLVQARARLGEGDERGAAKAYAALLDAHPGSAEAQAARMSLGRLRLAGGRPKAALGLFERYLQRGGPLAEEALWGKVQALAALERPAALNAAVDELVREFPRSVYRSRAQALLGR
jgi:TolA-binding protein